jgi:hypothetical protein
MSDLATLLLTIVTSLAGAYSTYVLAHRWQMNSIRAASLSSLCFVGLAMLSGNVVMLSLQPAFFGSTYVAMSEPHRLSRGKILFAAVLFGMILFLFQKTDFVHFHGGIGGTLGGTAFLACISVYWIQSLLNMKS